MAFPFAEEARLDIKALERRFAAAWSRTDEIFRIVRNDDFRKRPIAWRHPVIFYAGHLPAFAWNQVCGGILRQKSCDPYFDNLFSRGIDPDVDTGTCHSHPEPPDRWPAMPDVLKYRDKVRTAIVNSFGAVLDQDRTVLTMVLEHELMHQETLLYMIQQLPPEGKTCPAGFSGYHFANEAVSRPVEIPGGVARLGVRAEETDFGWDNEFQSAAVSVSGFGIDSLPVTNGRFLEFVEAGGYEDSSLWTKEDWEWKSQFGVSHPNIWIKQKRVWQYRTLFDLLPLSDVTSWPVYVSLAEANAYARWKGGRLPTEAEFHRAAFSRPGATSRFQSRETEPSSAYGNLNFVNWAPVPSGSAPRGVSPWGVYELVGNGWEWTSTPFGPFPGFTPLQSYPEYSADFFDGKHFVLKGGSWATASGLLRPSFRNWYQAHYPYVFAKFRCVADE
ncbi:MAG: SUMF1/EgtB/PvdO family nonheme iron enzyme [Candidatus Binatia bacterium]